MLHSQPWSSTNGARAILHMHRLQVCMTWVYDHMVAGHQMPQCHTITSTYSRHTEAPGDPICSPSNQCSEELEPTKDPQVPYFLVVFRPDSPSITFTLELGYGMYVDVEVAFEVKLYTHLCGWYNTQGAATSQRGNMKKLFLIVLLYSTHVQHNYLHRPIPFIVKQIHNAITRIWLTSIEAANCCASFRSNQWILNSFLPCSIPARLFDSSGYTNLTNNPSPHRYQCQSSSTRAAQTFGSAWCVPPWPARPYALMKYV